MPPQRFTSAISSDGRGSEALQATFVVTATVQLGYPESAIVGIGAILLASTLLYLVPHTAILGAILLTGYPDGAAASKVISTMLPKEQSRLSY